MTPGADAACVAHFGIKQGAEAALIGSLGSESKGSVVCLKSSDDVHFWLEAKDDCALRPATGKPPAVRYTFQPASRGVGIGMNSRNWYFNIAMNGTPVQDDATYKKGRFYTDNPGIATFPDPHSGHIKGVKKGKTMAHWDFDNKRQASAEIEVK